ncbi:flagellar filament capping protein FliD [Paenibacillus athensensis]|uniref:Flagellar hook-associated protein 2 C-terminal domain-containing protein n=1 Tax=Paenibacillus athensensis TaxID=1967502 RepID=A0A4Y8PXR5_9BACL|nr:flagellar filament capping protein FliD [Paenibacillus athensensis]MCD1259921.1 flagellar filament capping protein FliD [Paenibacillus athensensis]
MMMISASPIYMTNMYRANGDFYRVSAARAASPVKPLVSRQPLNLPFERLAYKQLAQTAASGVASLVQTAQNARQAAQAFLSGGGAALIDRRAVVSTKPGSVSGEAKSGAALKSYRVQVSAVATAQRNAGLSVSRAAASPVQQGWNELELQQDGEATRLRFYTGSGETAEQTLGKLRSAINRAGADVQAAMVDDGGGQSHLQLTSRRTGQQAAFTLRDIAGNAVKALGLNRTETAAQNAVYRVDGGPETISQSNDIELENGAVTLHLHAADDEEVTLTAQADSDAMLKPLKQLVDSYNRFRRELEQAPDMLNRSLLQSLERAARPSTLSQLGVTELEDGSLELDEAAFKQQVADHYGNVRQSLGGVSGLAASLNASFGKLAHQPAEALLRFDGSPLQTYSQYRAKLQAYLPVPLSGLLLDQSM